MSSFIVIKLGGNLLRPNALSPNFFTDLQLLNRDHHLVVVHGGGPQMSEAARMIGHTPTIVHGRRVTGDADLEIVKQVLGHQLNEQLVQDFKRNGLSASGVRGSEGIVKVSKRPPVEIDNKLIDFGWVGDIKEIHLGNILKMTENHLIPVIATMGADSAGQVFNVNGDTVAAEIAQALAASKLLFVTEIGQVLDHEKRTLSAINRDLYEIAKREAWIEGGMRVKVDLGFAALESGKVNSVWICGSDNLSNPKSSTEVVQV